ncbi:MAG: hypothetical protein J6B10_05440 [Lachnospiraceae bacterium]|nr:hypothetical protein [Lachnospiraceae bacterium]
MKRWVCLLLTAVFLTGCGIPQQESLEMRDGEELLQNSAAWLSDRTEQLQKTAEQITEQNILSEESSAEEQEKSEMEYPESDAKLLGAQRDYYAFSCLTADEQLLYIDMVQVLSHMAQDIEVRIPGENMENQDLSVIGKVFQCVMDDHPEFFYTDGYTYTRYTEGNAQGRLIRVTFSGRYTMSPAKRIKCEEKIWEYADQALSGINSQMSDYEKVKYIYEYIILHTDYNLKAKENQNICSVFLYGESVCQGYAKAVQYLLQQVGIKAFLVTGTVKRDEGHAWNLVQIDGDYYYVDATWGDASYELNGEKDSYEGMKVPSILYDYLCVTTEQLTRTHTIRSIVPMPQCTATQANYYIMEDAYFTGYDRKRIGALFEKAYARGDEMVTLKCSDSTAYEEIKRMLMDAKEIFSYLKPSGDKVAYTDNYDQLSLSFWL